MAIDTVDFLPTDDFVTHHGKNSDTFTEPPLDGSLVLAEMVDWHGAKSPNHPWAVFPSAVYKEGSRGGDVELTTVTWKHLQGAMHEFARTIQEAMRDVKVPKETPQPVIAVLANRDTLTYNAIMAGIIRAGCTAFLISPRNALAGVVHMLKASKTCLIIGSDDVTEKTLIKGVMQEMGPSVQVINAPVFGDLFQLKGDKRSLLPPMEHPTRLHETSVIIHSSGSTSFPKPIPLSHIGVLQWARIPMYGYHDFCGERVGIQSAPSFHGMGFYHCIAVPSASGCHIATFTPQEPPTRPNPERVLQAFRDTKITISTGPPVNLVEWVKDPEAVEYLKTLKWVRVGGGPLPSPIGDALVKQGVRVLNGWGTTEVGVLSNPAPKEHYGEDWEYIKCTRNSVPIFEPQDDEGKVFEICFGCTPTHTPSVFNDHENRIYRTSDLVELHPTREGFFKVVGRSDDQLMLNTGEKTNPGPMESVIRGHPAVKAAMYFGRGEFQNGVLVEPADNAEVDTSDEKAVAEYRNLIWPYVEEANKIAPTHSRIFKEMVVITTSDKPFLLTPKGSVSRPRTLALYEQEIAATYAAAKQSASSSVKFPETVDLDSLTQYTKALVEEVMNVEVTVNQDLFESGADSLQATFIRNRLLAGLKSKGKKNATLPTNLVYRYPTAHKLAEATLLVLNSETGELPAVARKSAAEAMDRMVVQYTADLPSHVGRLPTPAKRVAVITGSTGTLGCYLLHELYKDASVERIFALNRAGRGGPVAKQEAALKDRGVPIDILQGGKIICLDAELHKAKFGLDDAVYDKIAKTVTVIFNNAWRLDFNLPMTAFAPQLSATRNLIILSLQSSFEVPPLIVNSSSISVISGTPKGWVREGAPDAALVAPTGYGQSKYVAEKMLLSALPNRVVNVRIGQISGPSSTGSWNHTDWFPMIAKSAETTGCLPEGQDALCWIPADTTAKVINEFSLSTKYPETAHLVHPKPTTWSTMIHHLAKGMKVPVVPFAEWIEKVEANPDPTTNPAIKLLETYKRKPIGANEEDREAFGIPRAYSEKAEAGSNALRTMEQVGPKDVDAWLAYWRRIGFLA